MKKNHEKGDDHVTQSKKIRARSRWRTFQCMISRILIKSDDCAILEEFRSEFQCQFLVSNNHHVTQLKKIRARSRWRTFQYGFKNSYTNQMTAKFFRYFDQNSSVKWSCHAIKENSRKVEMTNFSMYGFTRSLHLCKYSHLSNKREVTLTDFEKKIHPPRLLIS